MSAAAARARVVEERMALNEKTDALRAFFNTEAFDSLPEIQRELLAAQLRTMETYGLILRMRLSNWEVV